MITASNKDNPPIISQNIIEDTVCLRVARPDVENAKIVPIDTSVTNANTKASAKSIQKIKSKSNNNKKNASNTTILGISDSSDSSDSDSDSDK